MWKIQNAITERDNPLLFYHPEILTMKFRCISCNLFSRYIFPLKQQRAIRIFRGVLSWYKEALPGGWCCDLGDSIWSFKKEKNHCLSSGKMEIAIIVLCFLVLFTGYMFQTFSHSKCTTDQCWSLVIVFGNHRTRFHLKGHFIWTVSEFKLIP